MKFSLKLRKLYFCEAYISQIPFLFVYQQKRRGMFNMYPYIMSFLPIFASSSHIVSVTMSFFQVVHYSRKMGD